MRDSMRTTNMRICQGRSVRSTSGVTLLEVLLVLAIIAVLIALIFPAIQAARQAALRTDVSNRLKQLELAHQQLQDSQGSHFGDTNHPAFRGGGGVFTLMLPYIEQPNPF